MKVLPRWWIFWGSREDKIFQTFHTLKRFRGCVNIEYLGSETNCEVSAKDTTGDSGYTTRFYTLLKIVCKTLYISYIHTVNIFSLDGTVAAEIQTFVTVGHSFSFNNW